MQGRHGLLKALLTAVVACVSGVWQAAAQEPTEEPVTATTDTGWEFTVTPYMWALSLDGSTTIRGRPADVDVGFSEILESLNIAAMVEAEARRDRFGAFVNVIYGAVGGDGNIGPIGVDVSTEMLWTNFGVTYRLGPYPLQQGANGSVPTVTFDPYIGGRYTYLNVDIDSIPLFSSSASVNWVDPIVGLRAIWDVSENWNIATNGNIGGFGAGSEFAWQVGLYGGYRFGLLGEDDANFVFGYQALGQRYVDDDRGFEWDVTAHGPVLGLEVQF